MTKRTLRYCLYFFYRFMVQFQYRNCSLYHGVKLTTVCDGISFFGYFNISPENLKKDVICLTAIKESVRQNEIEPIKIHLNSSRNIICTSWAWNWQQGCMAQWLGPEYENIIFNDYSIETRSYVSRIICKKGIQLKTLSQPVYSVSRCGKIALSLNFQRLALLRPDYGYFKIQPFMPNDRDDGIWLVNIEKNTSRLIVTLDQLKAFRPVPTMQNSLHKVNHLDFSPDGSKFMFLHRWVGPQGRYMRLMTAHSDGTELRVINGDSMTSHSCWFGNEKIISFCTVEGLGTGYFIFHLIERRVRFLSDKMPKHDGHPSVSPCQRYLITDTYPNFSGMSFLYLYDLMMDKIALLGRLYQPLRYRGELRIDLHPKWSLDGQSIYFESGHRGQRQLQKIDLDELESIQFN